MKLVYFGIVIHYGGGPKALVNIAQRLSSHHQVEVIDAYGSCKSYIKALEEANIPVRILIPDHQKVFVGYANNKIKRLLSIFLLIPVYLKLVLKLRATVKKIEPDAVWMNIKTSMLFWSITPGLRKIPVIRALIECPNIKNISPFERWCLKKRMHDFIAVSSDSAYLLNSLGIDSKRINVVSDTVDARKLIANSKLTLATELPRLDGYPKIVVPSTLLRSKGQHTAIKAASLLKNAGLDPVFWLAGDIVGNDNSYLMHLEGLVRKYGLENNVFFIGWREDVPAIIRHADIVSFPTQAEGFGLVVLEAFLLNKPLVTTYVGGIKDQIEQGVNALTFDVDDHGKMAECIKRLVEDPDLITRLTDQGYKTATTKFTLAKNTEGFLRAFEKVVQQP